MSAQNITIVGAGIAGLVTALSFARKGHEVDIIEQAQALSEVGAGLQISPNASRILIDLGLGNSLSKAMICPHQITLVSGLSLRKIAHVPCGTFAAARWGAPYGVMHRADLQAMLIEAVKSQSRCRLHLNQRVESATIPTLPERLGRPAPLLTVGADGVWSQTRHLVPGANSPRFSGQVAWRFKMPADGVRAILNPGNVTAFLGTNTHLVAYPIENSTAINMVAIARGADPGQTWAERENPTDRVNLLEAFRESHPDLLSILRDAPQMTWWPLFEVPDGRWSNDAGTVLIGDAAHAMTPFAAQGAAMAIEDGYELAQAVSDAAEDEVRQAVTQYETRRRIRIGRARKRAAFNRFAYHARGPVRLGRDLLLAVKSPESLASDLDWLYGYRAAGL
ncbi:MAG: FAD-dependent monooxygenase [Hoeflea sp.]|uniref:FAD-dependent monooxygenase n=1 Tax=Hoeflea sp. TaxID=1940281 RepID=UPI001D3388DD|nr:FAD-dependent monooxygenase [Hoeflea sp.]MBU4530666.1 FAD-dependent monooxygenase [Alphaproteobacteria bacterium]MBU4544886.1 FAD-dependent monooxygenase [Alphaproteobacteria bacterium]MBU4552029.1 FAD-dependent monooxygenase [Alphaproteobacteria bacterium]MBV1722218.1 FAD-dependent monooxygenase [Hoeflea sp.]MBV1761780.1 FAD-dependent monooxygenase [Hoeflea sp.]